jgi:hypothetical protein
MVGVMVVETVVVMELVVVLVEVVLLAVVVETLGLRAVIHVAVGLSVWKYLQDKFRTLVTTWRTWIVPRCWRRLETTTLSPSWTICAYSTRKASTTSTALGKSC